MAVLVDEIVRQYAALFVARGESSELDAFLRDRRSGLCAVTAPAGFGKTALLVDWLRRHHEQDCFVAHHIFSPLRPLTRERTGALRNLVRQCHRYFGIPDEPMPSTEGDLRGLLLGLLRDRTIRKDEPLVFLLDGLDEADDIFYSPFPDPLPDGVYVIVSCRAAKDETPPYLAHWVSENTPRICLDRLPRRAVAEWLRRAGEGALHRYAETDETEFVKEVDAKTEGYPLYLDYLVDELVQLAQRGEDVRAALNDTPPGFEATSESSTRSLVPFRTRSRSPDCSRP